MRQFIVSRAMGVLKRRERAQLAFVLLLSIVSTLLDLASISLLLPLLVEVIGDSAKIYPRWLQPLLDSGTDGTRLAIVLVTTFVLKNLLVLLITYVQVRTANSINARVVQQYYANLINKPYSFHVEKSSPELMRDVQDNAYSIVNGAVSPFLLITGELLTGAALLVYLFLTYPSITLAVALLLSSIAAVLFWTTRSPLKRLGLQRNLLRGDLLRVMAESFSGINEILVRGNQSWFASIHNRALKGLVRSNTRYQLLQTLPRVSFELGAIVLLAGLLTILRVAERPSSEVIGIVASFAFVAFRILPSIQRISLALQAVTFNLPLIAKALDELTDESDSANQPPEIAGQGGGEQSLGLEKSLGFEKLEFKVKNFSYMGTDEFVLRDAEFELARGETIAIVGESGSGKSTILSILVGLYQPLESRILVDGVNVFDHLTSWRKRLGYVPQETFLLDDTVRRNIVFAEECDETNDASVWAALERAALKEFVETLPSRLDTKIGENGIRFSGGQRQRLGLARALFRNPKVLILDEATSALDTETEQEILDSLFKLRRGIAVLMVTHRVTNLSIFDRVYTVQDGRLLPHTSLTN